MDDKTFDAQTAQDWIAAVEKPGQGARDGDIYPMLRAWLAQSGAASVVDIGCGQGICADKVAMQGVDYTGIDPSPLLIARAQEIYARDDRQFIVGNAYALPCGDAAFDAAFSVLVWHLLEDLPRAAAETARVIRPGGSFMCITANPAAIAAWQAMYAAPIVTGKRLEGGHGHGRWPDLTRRALFPHAGRDCGGFVVRGPCRRQRRDLSRRQTCGGRADVAVPARAKACLTGAR